MKKAVWLLNEYEDKNNHSIAITFWYGILEQLGYKVIYYPYETYEPEKFYQEMKEYKPDFIFHPCYTTLHTEFVKLREFTKIYVVQSDDDWRFENYAKFYIPFVDGTISYQADRQWYLNEGAKEEEIISTKWAFNPNTMLTDLHPVNQKDILLSHGGGLYGERSLLIQQFINKGTPVSIVTNVLYGQLLELWNRSKYSLCFTKSSQGNFRQKKGRLAEMGYYTVIVSEPFPNIEEYYEPDIEFIMFENIDEAVDKIKYYESNPNEYNKMLEASRNRVWNTNTCFHQWDRIMSIIDKDYKKQDINLILKNYL
jgi:hypothetical protein